MEQVKEKDLKVGVEHVLKLFLKEWNGAEVKNTIRYVTISNEYYCCYFEMSYQMKFTLVTAQNGVQTHISMDRLHIIRCEAIRVMQQQAI